MLPRLLLTIISSIFLFYAPAQAAPQLPEGAQIETSDKQTKITFKDGSYILSAASKTEIVGQKALQWIVSNDPNVQKIADVVSLNNVKMLKQSADTMRIEFTDGSFFQQKGDDVKFEGEMANQFMMESMKFATQGKKKLN